MKLFATVLSFLLLFAGNGPVSARETTIVTIIDQKPVTIVKGQVTELTVTAKIKKGFHIQANPASDEFLIPTILTMQTSEGIATGEPVYPPGQPYRLKGSTDDLLTYEDEVMIRVSVEVMDSAPAGNASITGKLRFQPCDDRKCLFPRSVPVVIPVKIVSEQK